MIPYNTDFEPLRLPEYGRTLQSLIDYCISIPDREERNDCAYSIAHVMGNLFPELIGENNDVSKIWDQMMIMSQFKLDVDFPCEVITEEKFNPRPEAISKDTSPVKFRHYGKVITDMIPVVADMPEGEQKEELISRIAHHMKKLLTFQNKDIADDERVFRDLEMLSEGRISLNPEKYVLHEFMEANKNTTPNRKKKKKN